MRFIGGQYMQSEVGMHPYSKRGANAQIPIFSSGKQDRVLFARMKAAVFPLTFSLMPRIYESS